jgi:hypothetical protein
MRLFLRGRKTTNGFLRLMAVKRRLAVVDCFEVPSNKALLLLLKQEAPT